MLLVLFCLFFLWFMCIYGNCKDGLSLDFFIKLSYLCYSNFVNILWFILENLICSYVGIKFFYDLFFMGSFLLVVFCFLIMVFFL